MDKKNGDKTKMIIDGIDMGGKLYDAYITHPVSYTHLDVYKRQVIETTAEHPFYVEGRGFINAGDLKAGDEVRTADGSTAAVESFESITPDEPIKVYNFEVEDFHTYYVSEQKVLVHNTCATTKKNVTTHKGKSGDTEYVVGAYKDVKGIEGMDEMCIRDS